MASRRRLSSVSASLLLLLVLLLVGQAQGFTTTISTSSISNNRRMMTAAAAATRRLATRAAAAATATSAAAAAAADAASVHAAPGLAALADKYDCFLIDQWGVMHDGHDPYPGAVECMRELVKAGKHIILLSNSSKRKAGSLTRLKAMGFEPADYLDVITSGELTYEGLTPPRAHKPYSEIQGTRVLVFGSGDDDLEYVTSLGCAPSGVEQGDFLLARGPFTILDSPAPDAEVQRFGPKRILHESPEFDALATRAAARGLPMIVSNPDIVRPGYDNDPMPGLLGQAYERKGGRVIYVGKPYPLVYERCRELLAQRAGGAERAAGLRVCAVGDSMMNDILGAVNQKYASILVTDGIHAEAMGVEQASGQEVAEAAREAFFQGFDYRPTHTVPRFRW